EGEQFGVRLGGSNKSGEYPGDGSAAGGDEGGLGEDHWFAACKGNFGKRKGDNAGDAHGDDLAPGIHSPPIPAQDVNRTSPAADGENDLPTLQNGSELGGDVSGENHQADGEELADDNVVALAGFPL